MSNSTHSTLDAQMAVPLCSITDLSLFLSLDATALKGGRIEAYP